MSARRTLGCLNVLAVAGALAVAVLAAGFGHGSHAGAEEGSSRDRSRLTDARGTEVDVGPYGRIVGGSLVADALLLELVAPTRIVAFSGLDRDEAPWRHRYAGKPTVGRLEDVEQVLSLAPDLVVVNSLSDVRTVARLEEAGIPVFDLGHMRGVDTLVEDARHLSALLGEPDRGARWVRTFERRLRAVASEVPEQGRVGALYVGVHGDRMYGGTTGTSFHDVIRHAGLDDVAAARFEGWPAYTNEQLLALNPPRIVTQEGMRRVLCGASGLEALRACGHPEGVIELPTALLVHPGPPMLEAAERLHAAVYDAPPR